MFSFRSSGRRPFMWPSGFDEEMERVYKQPGMGFVMVSHDITTDGASRGCEPNPLRGYSNTHTHIQKHTGMTSSPPHSRFHLAAPVPAKVFSFQSLLTPYLPPPLPTCHTHHTLHCFLLVHQLFIVFNTQTFNTIYKFPRVTEYMK